MSESTKTSDRKGLLEFSLHLNDIRELFEAPEFDPFVAQSRVTSGLDDIVNSLSVRPLRNPPRIKTTLRLPADQITRDLPAETRAALDRYCEFNLKATRQAMAASKFEGRTKLPVGIAVAAAVVIIAVIIFWLLPDYLAKLAVLLTPVITVIVWVSIWNPVETLLYDRWDERRNLQIHTAIQNMELHIQAD